jgi:RNA polymerase sigma factor (sigma-70 family)
MPIFRERPELLRAFRAGDRTALETVYRAYVDKVAGIVRFGFASSRAGGRVVSMGDRPHDLADAVQEVFAKSFSRPARESFDGLRDYGPYLFTVARNVVIDWFRRSSRELPTDVAHLEQALDEVSHLDSEPESPWADQPTMAIVQAFLAGLAPELKRVHQARYAQGLSQRDAAAALGISRQNLRTLERRLRDDLRLALDAGRQDAGVIGRPSAGGSGHGGGGRSEAIK